jgi:hypothetical protein
MERQPVHSISLLPLYQTCFSNTFLRVNTKLNNSYHVIGVEAEGNGYLIKVK